MPYHSITNDADANAVTKPKIVKNWLILVGGVIGIGVAAFFLLWPSGPAPVTNSAPTAPPNPLTGISVPRDDTKATRFLGVTGDGRYVIAAWRTTGAPVTHELPEDRPPLDAKQDTAGLEIWDRQQGQRTRRNSLDELFFDPTAGAVVILQELAKSSVVHRLTIAGGERTKVLDTAEVKDVVLTQQGGRRMFVSTDGRIGVAFGKTATGEATLLQWDLVDGKLTHRVKVDPSAELVGVSNDGKKALLRLTGKKLLESWNLAAEKLVATSSIGTAHFVKQDVFLRQSPYLADYTTYALRLYSLPESDPNARWSWRCFDGTTGKAVDLGPDDYEAFDPGSGLWLRARDGTDKQTAWELVKAVGRGAPIHARVNVSSALKIRHACFVPVKGQLACYCEIEGGHEDDRRLIQVFDLRTGNLYGEVRRPGMPMLDNYSLLATANGSSLLFLTKLEKDDRLESWKITPKLIPVAPKKKVPDKDPPKAF